MIRSLGDKRTQRLFADDVVRALQAIARPAKRKLTALDIATRLGDVAVPPANRLEPLKGDLLGFHSIRVNDQWRTIFRWFDADAFDVRIVDYH